MSRRSKSDGEHPRLRPRTQTQCALILRGQNGMSPVITYIGIMIQKVLDDCCLSAPRRVG